MDKRRRTTYVSGETEINYRNKYLTIEPLEDGVIALLIHVDTNYVTSVSYSTDNGRSWTTVLNEDNVETYVGPINVNAGDQVLFKGIANCYSYYGPNQNGGYPQPGSFFMIVENENDNNPIPFNLSGNIMSLLYGDNFRHQNSLLNNPACFSYLFAGMFINGASGLTNAENLILPATTLSEFCYGMMFGGCPYMISFPELPATVMAPHCYDSMFWLDANNNMNNFSYENYRQFIIQHMSELSNLPELPAETLADYCYHGMFYGRFILNTIELPAETLADYCYQGMFSYCCFYGDYIPELPAETLAEGCYADMFSYSQMSNAPELPATTLEPYCYSNMFQNAYIISGAAPVLPATTLVSYCYEGMFNDCFNINYINAAFLTTPGTNYTNSWVEGVASEGIFIKNQNASWNVVGIHGIPEGWVTNVSSITPDSSLNNLASSWVTISSPNNGTIIIRIGDVITSNQQYAISTDHVHWMFPQANTYYMATGNIYICGNNNLPVLSLQEQLNFYNGNYDSNDSKYAAYESFMQEMSTPNQNYNHIKIIGSNISLSGNIVSLWNGGETYNSNYQLRPWCGAALFSGNSSITSIQNLTFPSTTLAIYCYANMFYECSSLTIVPNNLLPATTLAEACYDSMFYCCYSLSSLPNLPATTLAPGCYSNMFYNTSITSIPNNYLPATTLAPGCYSNMFCLCQLLTSIPSNLLPATTLTDGCYAYMFAGCYVLTNVPSDLLPATTLATACYYDMFADCQSLERAPNLPATYLSYENCYFQMFYGCSSLNYIKALFTGFDTSNNKTIANYTGNWVYNVASSGTFFKNSDATWNETGVNGVPTNWNITSGKEWAPIIPDQTFTPQGYVTISTSVSVNNMSGPEDFLTIEYNTKGAYQTTYISLDHEHWQEMTEDYIYVPWDMTENGGPITTFYICGNLSQPYSFPAWDYEGDWYWPTTTNFKLGGSNISISGNLNSIWSYQNLNAALKAGCGATLFTNNSNIISISGITLPSTTLATECYGGMFSNCSSITSIPSNLLPATTLTQGCYESMFNNTSITSLPNLPATTLAPECYCYMFAGTSITSIPNNYLPITTLAYSCYEEMFYNCESLTSVPSNLLPATTLADYCYAFMFSECSSLTSLPNLPATTLAHGCYSYMFTYTSITSIPNNYLPATTLADYCYNQMFYGCRSLTTIPSNLLPATVLSEGCYQYMFSRCSLITTAPDLPATTLVSNCYSYMFQNCSSLNYIKALFLTEPGQNYTYNWVNGVANSGTFVANALLDMGYVTWNNFSEGPNTIPVGWNVNFGYEEINGNMTFTPQAYVTISNNSNQDNIIMYVNKSSNQTTFISTDHQHWQEMQPGVIYYADNGDPIYMCGNLSANNSGSDYTTYGLFANNTVLEGNINSLWNYSNTSAALKTGCGYKLFAGSQVSDISNLYFPSTTLAEACYANMFEGCPITYIEDTWIYDNNTETYVTDSYFLPATTLAPYCYNSMFKNCEYFVGADITLPATTAASYCYGEMFYGCTSMTGAPYIATTTMASYSCHSMFEGCTSLQSIGYIPATTLASYCYDSMFKGCTLLNTAPYLPAITLAERCYASMFEGCTSLSNFSQEDINGNINNLTSIAATTLAPYCCYNMFKDCESLEYSSALMANTLVSHCYENMFYGCESLNQIIMIASDISATDCLKNWVVNVAQTGDFIKHKNTSIPTGVNGIPTGWNIAFEIEFQCDNYFTTTAYGNGTIDLYIPSYVSTSDLTSVSYSKNNGQTWTTTNNTNSNVPISVNVNDGDIVLWKGLGNRYATYDGDYTYCTFDSTVEYSASGNIMSLLFGDNFRTAKSLSGKTLAFSNLFYDSVNLVDISELCLPATTLSERCYTAMFNGCTGITTMPGWNTIDIGILMNGPLPADTLSEYCYAYMFEGCTSLQNGFYLPATTLAENCYEGMFHGCSALTSISDILPATTLANSCYSQMFKSCYNLTTVTNDLLPATTLTPYCYSEMFCECEELTTPPDLPATTLATNCYYKMFCYCYMTSAPELPALTLTNGCYWEMFKYCDALNYIKMLATNISATNCLTNWVQGVANSGMFVKNDNMNSLPIGVNGIPTGWVSVNESEESTYLNYSKYFTIKSLANNNTIGWKCYTSNAKSIEWSSDLNTWTSVTATTSGVTITTLNNGQTIYIRGNNTTYGTNSYYNYFTSTGNFEVSGNIMSLIAGDNFVNQTSLSGTYTFKYLFNSCTYLINANNLMLPATTLTANCYQYMFYGCTNLQNSPVLSATTLTNYCYSRMFQNCSSLTTPPVLQATTLAQYCYEYMFSGCSSLTTAPTLSATTLANNCYQYMFSGCSNLTTAPTLSATILASNCYRYMFQNCSSLKYIKAMFTTTPGTNYTNNWVSGVAASGTFVKNNSATWAESFGSSAIPKDTSNKWLVINDLEEPYYNEYLTITSLANNNEIKWKCNNSGNVDNKTIQWSTDKINWNSVTSLNSGATITTLSNGSSVYIKGNNTAYGSSNGHSNYFVSTGNFNATGNIMSLVYGDNFKNQISLSSNNAYVFYRLFQSSYVNNTNYLIMPAITLASFCYSSMFYNCTRLVSAPKLPATTLASNCYSNMFESCTSLTSVPSTLPATTLTTNCYQYMFSSCSSLIATPTLPATTLASYCYSGMFLYCYNLTTVTTLPASTMVDYCYQYMFGNCTSLTSAPALNSTSLAQYCYQNMFRYCDHLTSAPSLPATTLAAHCYDYMFIGCTMLINAPTISATTLADYCYFHMFENCTALTNPPTLNVTTLTNFCYNSMFYGCTSLTTAPDLPASTLATSCYQNMFYGCTSLNYIKMLATNISASSCLTGWVTNVAATGTFVKDASMTTLPTGANGIPTGWLTQDLSIYEFDYIGNVESMTLTPGTYIFECWGAQGGSTSGDGGTGTGGKGGYSTGELTLSSNTTVYVYAGGQGQSMTNTNTTYAGGFNGGGACRSSRTGNRSGTGGGASDIRIGTDSLYARVIVAGGGGGFGYNYAGGVGGGESGTRGSSSGGQPGTQTAAGTANRDNNATAAAFGVGGGSNGTATSNYIISGGGGGWYGGAHHSALTTSTRGGGGGSGYVYTSSTASNYPSGCLLNSTYYLSNASTAAGNTSMPKVDGTGNETGHSGNGYVRITKI